MSIKYPLQSWAQKAIIYEVNLRQYTKSGSIAEFRTHLPRIKQLGVDILWFMPLQPIGKQCRKGSMGSYYSISNYRTIDPFYGTMDEFIDLVHEIHRLGMYVILDWVANHTAWDHEWVQEHPEFYRRNEAGEVHPPFPEWEDVIGLDYNNAALQEQMISEMDYWVTLTGIDGFRCDMANLVPTSFWNQARKKLNKHKRLFMLAEAEQRELLEEAFDVLYNWKTFHAFNDIAAQHADLWHLKNMIHHELIEIPSGSSNLLFISNHDENSWNGSELERLGLALEAFALLIFTLPGMPLLYTGMEAGNAKRLQFFDKDEIEWKEDKMAALYTKLCQLRKESHVLKATMEQSTFKFISTTRDDKILCFARETENEKLLVVVNLSPEQVNFQFIDDNIQGSYQNVITNTDFSLHTKTNIELKGWGYFCFVQK